VADGLTRTLGTRVPLLGQVPIDLRLREGSDNGKPLVLTDPDSPAAAELRRIAGVIGKKPGGLKGLRLGLSPTGR
jgi:ATP-binding protein involved in chromosome partitioning